LDMNRAIGAARERLANHLLDTRRTGAADHHFPAVPLAQSQRFLERVGVRLVHLVADVLLADPGLVVVEPRLPLAGRNLLDTDGDLRSYPSYFLKSNAAFVPPKPNEFDSA